MPESERGFGTKVVKPRGLVAGLVVIWFVSVAAAGEVTEEASPSPSGLLERAARHVSAGDPVTAITTLKALETGSVPPAVRQQADLLLGILLVRQGEREEAIARLERAAALPLLGDYALWHLAGAYRRGGQRAEAAAALERIVGRHPDSLFGERASRDLPRDWLEAGDLPKAEEAAKRYLTAFPQGAGRAEVWTALGEVLLRTGRTEQAEEVLRRVWIELPSGPESQGARELLATIPGARPFTPEEQFERAMTLYRLGRYVQAVAELGPFGAPGNPKELQARLSLGVGSFRLRQYPQAVRWLEPLRDDTSADRAEALFWLGRASGRAGDAAKFTEYLTLLVDTSPQTQRAEEGLYLLAQSAADNGDTALAHGYLERHLREYPKSAWRDSALWLQGWLVYKGRAMEEALGAWDRLLAEETGSRFRTAALYWRGRALEAMKRPREAALAYLGLLGASGGYDYYWFRAKQRLERLGKRTASPPAITESAAKWVAKTDTLRVRKARALQRLSLEDEAADEYSEQVRSHPEDRGGLAEACRAFLEVRRFDKAVWLAKQILRPLFVQGNGRPPIPEFWRCLYPQAHWSLVREEAARENLDPFLVTALMREESAFAPRAVSSAGARGLMQLMPQTAEQVARDHKLGLGAAAALESPEVSIRLGTIHLADLVRDHGGNLSLALAAYNAGQQQVRRWTERFGFTDEEEFTEDIPYTETRNYVKRVLGSYRRYASLYGMKPAESREPRKTRRAPNAGERRPRSSSRHARVRGRHALGDGGRRKRWRSTCAQR